MLRPRQTVINHTAVLRRGSQRRSEELPQYDRTEMRVSVIPENVSMSQKKRCFLMKM